MYTITQPTINPIDPANSTQTICADQIPQELVVTYTSQNGTGAASYQWYSNTTNTNEITGATPIAGATASSFTPTPADLTPNATTFFFVGITLENCNEKASQVFTVEVAPEISFTTQPETSQEVCEGGIATTPLSVVAAGAGTNGATYQWYQSETNDTTAGIPVATSNTYTPDFTGVAIAVQTNYYYYAIVTTTQGCTLTSAIATVVVSPALAATITPNTEQTVCENEEVILSVTLENGQGEPTYQWYDAADPTTALASTPTFTAPTDIAGTKAYYAIVSYTQGPCTTITTETVSIVVTQTPVIADAVATIVSYTGTPFTYDPTTEAGNTIPTGTQYTWTVSNPGNITGASAVTTPENVISQTLTNTGTTDITINYTVTPIYNGCEGTPFEVTVSVTAPINVTATITNATCFEDGTFLGNGAIATSITGGVPPYTVTWSATNGYTSTASKILQDCKQKYIH